MKDFLRTHRTDVIYASMHCLKRLEQLQRKMKLLMLQKVLIWMILATGLQAVAELGVKSPLREAGLTKAEIRELSKEMGLSTWEKPSFACLASRFVYGETISKEKLIMVESAEQLLL